MQNNQDNIQVEQDFDFERELDLVYKNIAKLNKITSNYKKLTAELNSLLESKRAVLQNEVDKIILSSRDMFDKCLNSKSATDLTKLVDNAKKQIEVSVNKFTSEVQTKLGYKGSAK